MSEDSAQERTEEPSDKKLRDARDKGQVPRSKELNTTIMLVASALGLMALGASMGEQLSGLITEDLMIDRRQVFDKAAVLDALQVNTMAALSLLAPFMGLMLLAVFVGPLLMGGFQVSAKAMAPKFSKLNPLSGIKKMFGLSALVELLKALAKVGLLGGVAVWLLSRLATRYIELGQTPLLSAVGSAMDLISEVFLVMSITLGFVAMIDVPYQLWDHKRKLKMSRQELKEESKETNGNPEMKGRIRQAQQQLSQQRTLQDIPQADVIIVNPTHFAVALAYDPTGQSAPRVLGKGIDHLALKMREVANAHEVPIFEAPPLARALYHHSDIGQEIPEELYLAVAQVLAYVFQLKQDSDIVPLAPTDLPVPTEMDDADK